MSVFCFQDRVRTESYKDFIYGNPSIFKDKVLSVMQLDQIATRKYRHQGHWVVLPSKPDLFPNQNIFLCGPKIQLNIILEFCCNYKYRI